MVAPEIQVLLDQVQSAIQRQDNEPPKALLTLVGMVLTDLKRIADVQQELLYIEQARFGNGK